MFVGVRSEVSGSDAMPCSLFGVLRSDKDGVSPLQQLTDGFSQSLFALETPPPPGDTGNV